MSESRKKDHIDMSFASVPSHRIDMMDISYEPLLSAHPHDEGQIKQSFLGFDFAMPLWISSMTGGTEKAYTINQNLARVCDEFQIGMGLGSCRPLLDGDERLKDFDVKSIMPNAPLFANFGVAQIEQLFDADQIQKLKSVLDRLQTDGVIVHVNPLQEWAQEEGDKFKYPPIETIKKLCDVLDCPIMVKEVGQGMGPKSLEALLNLPIAGIELAGFGGTNFSLLEQRRKKSGMNAENSPSSAFAYIGHTPSEMITMLNELHDNDANKTNIIISGGVKDPLSGYVLKQSLHMNSVIGMAGAVLKHAMGEYEELQTFMQDMRESFLVAHAYLLKNEKSS